MASTVSTTGTTSTHYVVSVLHPSGTTHQPRFRNVSPDARTIVQYQADCQAAAVKLSDATVAQGPNATAALLDLR